MSESLVERLRRSVRVNGLRMGFPIRLLTETAAEIERLTAESNRAQIDLAKAGLELTEALAERDRYREALEAIQADPTHHTERCNRNMTAAGGCRPDCVVSIARRALQGETPESGWTLVCGSLGMEVHQRNDGDTFYFRVTGADHEHLHEQLAGIATQGDP